MFNAAIMSKITLIKGDITKVTADAIVNAANSSLLGGGGVDGAIHRVGGPKILEACRQIRAKKGGCKTGEAVITTAGDLPAKYVIHTVGPVWQAAHESRMKHLLANCYSNSLSLAVNNQLATIAFPNISTGIYKFPKEMAASVAIQAVNDFLEDNSEIKEVVFVCFDQENFDIYDSLLKKNDSI